MAVATKWSDDKFLDTLRSHGDADADACAARVSRDKDYRGVFAAMRTNCDPVPDGTPHALREFFAATHTLPCVEADRTRFLDGVDHARVRRGEAVFMDHAVVSCLVLLAKSMPEGYAAPCLSRLLNLSGNLKHHPYKRLLGVLQMVVNVMENGAFESTGRAIVTAQQVRLMHAGIRDFTRRNWNGYDGYVAEFGLPVNLEDMLGTIMGLSLLVIEGMQDLRVPLTNQQAEDYYYSWRLYAQMMGIHPPGKRDSNEWVPATVAEAREFYDSYERRHYVNAAQNPDGVELARQNLAFMEFLMPRGLRRMGMQGAASFYMTKLIGDDACRRVGLTPFGPHPIRRAILMFAIRFWAGAWRAGDHFRMQRSIHRALSDMLFKGLIRTEYQGGVTFDIPHSVDQLHQLIEQR